MSLTCHVCHFEMQASSRGKKFLELDFEIVWANLNRQSVWPREGIEMEYISHDLEIYGFQSC